MGCGMTDEQTCPTPFKQSYAKRRTASIAAKQVARHRKATQLLHPYECLCGQWHLASKPYSHRATQTGQGK